LTNFNIPFSLRNIDHVVLKVHDIENMTMFYTSVLGCEVERKADISGLVQLRAGDSIVDLLDARSNFAMRSGAPPDGSAPNMDHFCLYIEPWDGAAIIAHLERHAVEHGPIEHRRGARGTGPSIYVLDPEGNSVELKG
jgi:glyoxylase I family protein